MKIAVIRYLYLSGWPHLHFLIQFARFLVSWLLKEQCRCDTISLLVRGKITINDVPFSKRQKKCLKIVIIRIF